MRDCVGHRGWCVETEELFGRNCWVEGREDASGAADGSHACSEYPAEMRHASAAQASNRSAYRAET
jgi:hypothetical protein